MILKVIITIILYITLIVLMYNVIIGVRTNDDKLTVLCGIGAGLVGILCGTALSSIIFNI